MTDKVFLDTNVLVYAYDFRDPEKQRKAEDIICRCMENANGFVSAQVLGEFFTVVTRKIARPMTPAEARDVIGVLSGLPVQEIDREMVVAAIDCHEAHSIAYWDALIVAAAERSGCSEILSEDLSDGQRYKGIPVRNPFT